DEDGGWVGRAVRERLADEPSVRVRPVATAAAARALVQAKRAPAALVVPAGTSDAVGAGRAAALVLLSDPVRTVDVAYVRGLAQELRHGLEAAAVERAQHDLDAARAQATEARAHLARAGRPPGRPRPAAARAAGRAARTRGAGERGPRCGGGAPRRPRRCRADAPARRGVRAPGPSRIPPPLAPRAARRPPPRPARARGDERHRRAAPPQHLRSERAGLRRALPPARRAAR